MRPVAPATATRFTREERGGVEDASSVLRWGTEEKRDFVRAEVPPVVIWMGAWKALVV